MLLIKRLLKATAAAIAAGLLLIACAIAFVQLRYVSHMHAVQTAPQKPIAIILGASVTKAGEPSDALRDRIQTGIDLYRAGKVNTLLMTGDDGAFHIDEIAVMAQTAREQGIPDEAIKTDGHGYRTYESCKRAAKELNIQSALVVTQRFHLGRAVFLCRSFGIDAEGVVADRQHYIRSNWFWMRDLLSSAKAFWDIHIQAPASPVQQ
jgi:SanA protein